MESVCFTGACPDMTREELTEMAEEKFEVRKSVTKDLDILVCADPNAGSSKLEKAKKNGTRIISYEDFLEMLDSDDDDDDDEDGLYSHAEAKKILKHLRKAYAEECVRINTSVENEPLPMTASKFGGLPYWEKGVEFPKTSEEVECEQEPLFLLAQINFAEVPHLPDYPEKGLLQIFIYGDDLYGSDCYDEQGDNSSQKLWRIVWHEDFSEERAMTESELHEMGVRSVAEASGDDDNYFPLDKEYAISFEKALSFVTPCLDDFDEKIRQAAKDLALPVYEDEDSCDMFSENDFENFCDDNAPFHQIGGLPFYTQSDVRREGDILLFQMDSEHTDNGWEILWGDSGVANFFIKREDLKKKDFSHVIYNWDCY